MRTHPFAFAPAAAALLVCLTVRPASAQPLSIPWFTTDAGGGRSSAADFELHGTVGQPDVGDQLAGGAFQLAGGFWNIAPEISCAADFNNDGAVTVQDIFDFLRAWFGGCFAQSSPPCNGFNADINQSGSISPQDIFDFLHVWFTRCPGY